MEQMYGPKELMAVMEQMYGPKELLIGFGCDGTNV